METGRGPTRLALFGGSVRRLGLVRPTPRGWTLGVGSVGFATAGTLIGSVDLVRVAVLLGVVLVVGVLSLLPDGPAVRVERTVAPEPLHVGGAAQVQVVVVGAGATAVHEQIAPQLVGNGPPPRVWRWSGAPRSPDGRAPNRIVLDYSVYALVRGRWPLGPLTVTRSDVFGTVRRTTTLGTTDVVRVWPYVVPLGAPDGTTLGEPEQVALGAHEPSPDDVALREYAEGDDLRRVHWASSARRGRLMVRADEHAGLRPVTVVAAVPSAQSAACAAELEWTLSLAASVACAAFDAGHLVTLLGLGGPGEPVSVRTEAEGRARLLAPTLDATCARSAQESAARLERTLAAVEPAGQLVVAVLGTTDQAVTRSARTALGQLASGARCWVVTGADGPAVADLRRAGCRVVVARPGDRLDEMWRQLVAQR
ncbi:MAG: DUF58 domain-containing protein [Micrococcales bacterium]|nr:DUF58 domain-containing protein [Micrococcales bacterium]